MSLVCGLCLDFVVSLLGQQRDVCHRGTVKTYLHVTVFPHIVSLVSSFQFRVGKLTLNANKRNNFGLECQLQWLISCRVFFFLILTSQSGKRIATS